MKVTWSRPCELRLRLLVIVVCPTPATGVSILIDLYLGADLLQENEFLEQGLEPVLLVDGCGGWSFPDWLSVLDSILFLVVEEVHGIFEIILLSHRVVRNVSCIQPGPECGEEMPTILEEGRAGSKLGGFGRLMPCFDVVHALQEVLEELRKVLPSRALQPLW